MLINGGLANAGMARDSVDAGGVNAVVCEQFDGRLQDLVVRADASWSL
jgi:hypothetical protein